MALSLLGSIADRLREDHLRGRPGGFDPAVLTIVGDGVGTVGNPEALPADQAYVAPELRGGVPTPAGDAFAFAVFAHELLVGGRPGVIGTDAPSMAARHPGLPSYAAEAFANALGSEPAARPLPRSLLTAFSAVPTDGWPVLAPTGAAEPPPPASDSAQPGDQTDQTDQAHDDAAVPIIDPLTEFIPENAHHGGEWVRASSRRGKRAKRASRTRQSTAERRPDEASPATDPLPVAAPQAPLPVAVEQTPAPAVDVSPATDAPIAPDRSIQGATVRSDAEAPQRLANNFDLPEVFRNPPATRWTPERIQQFVLIAVILVLIVAGILYALSRDGEPQYDPALQGQGASLSIIQPVSAGR